jgi:LPPG:FO 2-phospho-L-lactate transferase
MSVLALSGGVGGAKLALGLYRVLAPGTLRLVVNTGDDFDHLGLRICPDLDTALYTLGDLEHREQGWGRRDETWTMMRVTESLGGDTWFRLGDADTALHLHRTQRLRAGESLTSVIMGIAARFGIDAAILPMTDDTVATRVTTDAGELAFQEYFVRRRCEPKLLAIRFDGAERARPTSEVLAAFADPALEAIVLCPSNPYLSIDPLLAIPALRTALVARRVPVIAVSPLIGTNAVKGPTAKIMAEMGIESSPAAIAAHYAGLVDALVVDNVDQAVAALLPIATFATATLMKTLEDRVRLARFVLERARELRR